MLAIGAAIYLVSVRVTREFEDALQREIVATGALFEQLRVMRAETLTMRAKLIADNPRLKAAVDTNDPPTVQDLVNDYREQLDAVAWDEAERERVIAEVLAAYRLNTELFDDLAAAKAAA